MASLPRRLAPLATLAAAALALAAPSATAADIADTAGSPSTTAAAVPVAPYVDMGAWPTPSLSAMSAASGIKSYTLGFVTGAGCKASWFNAYDPRSRWQQEEINKIRANGGDVKISFGGASGIELAQACGTVSALTTEYNAVIDAYQANYIDLDIEGAAAQDSASIERRSQALAAVKRSHPNLKISVTLPVLPTGLTDAGLNVVRSAKNAGITLDKVNIMAMDYYQGPADQGAKAIQAATSTKNQLKTVYTGLTDAQAWAMVGVTPMIGVNDSQNEIFYQEDAQQLVNFAKQQHIGMLSFWEATRDRNACTGALYQCTNISQQPYDFAKIFATYTG